MKKVTKRLLVACVAALSAAACQDQIVIPQPPPPPPPPPGVDATVTIQGLRTIPGNAPVNPTAVFGDINVVLNIAEGDNTVTQVDVVLDGTPIGCTSISTNRTPDEGVRLSQGAADVVECFFNSDDVLGACVGEQLDPANDNGTHTLGARITLDDGTTRTASNAQQITLANTSFILLAVVDEPVTPVVGGSGRLYHGGDDIVFGACPVSYNGTTVGSVSVVGTDNGGAATSCDQDQGGATFGACGSVDLGSGAGAVRTDASPPFTYTAAASNNDAFDSGSGDAGTGVEDLGTGAGHTLSVTGSVFADDGLNVTTEFAGGFGSITGFYMDFTPPRVNCNAGCAAFTASEITISEPAAGSSTALTWYSEGNFGLSNVQEEGVGWSFGAGGSMDVGDCSDTDNSDAADATDFVPLFSDVSSIDDVDEEDWELGGDGFAGTDSGDDCLLGELRSLADNLTNATRLADPGSIPAQIQTLTAFGKDATPADISNPQPAATILVLNPDANANGMVCADAGDCTLMLDALDPDLASGDPGSGVNETGCDPCSNVTSEIDDGPGSTNDGETLDVSNNGTLTSVDEDFVIDLTSGSGTFPLADGAYEITLTAEDNATPANEATYTFAFDLDDTAPGFGALNPAPVGSAGTDASAIVMTIGGTISDAHIIDTAKLSVYVDGSDNIGTGANNTCDAATDFKLSVTGGDIDRNDVDLTDGTSSISFNESFTITQPDAASRTLRYCFVLSAEDEAVLKDGTDTGNTSSLNTAVDVTWNAG